MGIVSGIVVFCCTWWLVFFMIMSQGFERDTTPMAGTPKSAPKKFPSFEERAEETRDENSDQDREIVGRFPLYGNFRKCR